MTRAGTHEQVTFKSSTFFYYGPQSPVLNSSSAVFLNPSELCDPELHKREYIRGRVVAGSRSTSTCLIDDVYARLESAGASAFIVTDHNDPPGHLSFRHNTWAREKYRSPEHLIMVECFDPDDELEVLLEPSQNRGDVELAIRRPHDTSWRNAYLSTWWTFGFKITIPIFAAVTFRTALGEVFFLV